jgi:hypothetical protein
MLHAILTGTSLVLLLGGGWLIWLFLLSVFLILLSTKVVYTLRWHEKPLCWMFSKFLTNKTGVRVSVKSVTLRTLESRSQIGVGTGRVEEHTHAVFMAEEIAVSNPPGFSAHPLSTVGSVQVHFDPWSIFSPSVVVQSIHIEDVELHLER